MCSAFFAHPSDALVGGLLVLIEDFLRRRLYCLEVSEFFDVSVLSRVELFDLRLAPSTTAWLRPRCSEYRAAPTPVRNFSLSVNRTWTRVAIEAGIDCPHEASTKSANAVFFAGEEEGPCSASAGCACREGKAEQSAGYVRPYREKGEAAILSGLGKVHSAVSWRVQHNGISFLESSWGIMDVFYILRNPRGCKVSKLVGA